MLVSKISNTNNSYEIKKTSFRGNLLHFPLSKSNKAAKAPTGIRHSVVIAGVDNVLHIIERTVTGTPKDFVNPKETLITQTPEGALTVMKRYLSGAVEAFIKKKKGIPATKYINLDNYHYIGTYNYSGTLKHEFSAMTDLADGIKTVTHLPNGTVKEGNSIN